MDTDPEMFIDSEPNLSIKYYYFKTINRQQLTAIKKN
jgi:hypothetical protein